MDDIPDGELDVCCLTPPEIVDDDLCSLDDTADTDNRTLDSLMAEAREIVEQVLLSTDDDHKVEGSNPAQDASRPTKPFTFRGR